MRNKNKKVILIDKLTGRHYGPFIGLKETGEWLDSYYRGEEQLTLDIKGLDIDKPTVLDEDAFVSADSNGNLYVQYKLPDNLCYSN